jgi:hypothetical protein
MPRRLFTLLSALSLLLCVAVAALWVRSCYVSDSVGRVTWDDATDGTRVGWRESAVISARGTLAWFNSRQAVEGQYARFFSDLGPTRNDRPPEGWHRERRPPDRLLDRAPSVWNRIGFLYEHQDIRTELGLPEADRSQPWMTPELASTAWMAADVTFLGVPHWLVLVATAVAPTWWLARLRSRVRRKRRGLCPRCGYDLRATPGRCPECGTFPAGIEA